MVEINILGKPSEREDMILRNRIISNHRLKKFLSKFSKYDCLIYLSCHLYDSSNAHFTIIDNPDEFLKKINNTQKFLKIRTIMTKLQKRESGANFDFLRSAFWEDGLWDYQDGEATKYSTFERFINKSSLKSAFIGEEINNEIKKIKRS